MADLEPVMTATHKRPVLLCILDGWGWREEFSDNAVALGFTPNFDRYWATSPRGFLWASERAVGLPGGQMGNSEVGHMNLGAGRVLMQDLPRIDEAIESGALAQNPVLLAMIDALKHSGGTCHLLGLASPGGVHAHQDHMAALARIVSTEGVPVAIHAFTDGRDVAPSSARDQIAKLLQDVAGLPGVRLATISGRYYAMDRDTRWERVKLATEALALGDGPSFADPLAAIEASYAAGITDEFVLPMVAEGYAGMKDGDALLMANFRSDRAREILTALTDPGFEGFARPPLVRFAAMVGMARYSEALDARFQALFEPSAIENGLGETVAAAGLTQLRVAETEKYPHVTFFFNGGREQVYPGEDRILVPSPKVATYDLQPEMSADEVTSRTVAAIDSGAYDLVVLNYANPDMVGHTGSLPAAIQAVEAVDRGLGQVLAAIERQGGSAFVTADHGNCELMRDPETGGPHTSHTLNKVPAFVVGAPAGVTHLEEGRLADVAPTLLQLLGLPQPAAMTGHSLLRPEIATEAALVAAE